jgi:hypothetical protein
MSWGRRIHKAPAAAEMAETRRKQRDFRERTTTDYLLDIKKNRQPINILIGPPSRVGQPAGLFRFSMFRFHCAPRNEFAEFWKRTV